MRRLHMTLVTLVVVAVVAAIPLPATTQSAQAHTATPNWYDAWHQPIGTLQGYRFTAGYPTSSVQYRNRIKDAFATWNARSAGFEALCYGACGDYANFNPYAACGTYDEGTNGIHWLTPTNPNALGQNRSCATGT